MRSMATPIDHIDMMNRTNATALPTQVIWCHISIRFRPPSPIVLSSGVSYRFSCLLQRELNGDGHDDRYGNAVEQRRRELPLAYGIERRVVEQRNRPEHLRIGDLATRTDRRLDDHDPLDARRLRDGRIRRTHILGLHRRLDVAADAHRCGGRRRWRRGFRQAADDAAHHTAGDASFDTAGYPH